MTLNPTTRNSTWLRMKDLPATSHSLLRRLTERSDDAWGDFLLIYGRAIYGFCRQRGLQDADAEDVCSQVMAALEQTLVEGRLDLSRGSLRGWLCRVARNLAVNNFREKAKEVVGSGDTRVNQMLANHPQTHEEHCSALWLEYRSQLFHWAAKQVQPVVNEMTWQAFWRTAVDGLDAESVAADLQTTVGNVYTAKCRVIARLRKLIGELEDDPLESSSAEAPR